MPGRVQRDVGNLPSRPGSYKKHLVQAEPEILETLCEPLRRWRRYHFHVPVRLARQTAVDRTETVGRGTEINEGGIGVHAPIELAVGEQVDLEFSPTYSGIPVRLQGIVRNRTRDYYGLEFLARDETEQRHVDRIGQLLRGASDYLIED